MSNSFFWCLLLLPIPLISVAWYAQLTSVSRRMPRANRWALIILSASYLLILLELAVPQFLGRHYGVRRDYTILANMALSLGVLVVGAVSRSTVGLAVALAAAVVGLGWLYLGAVGSVV